MDITSILDFFRHFETQRVLAWLQQVNFGEWMQNRYVLGVTAVLAAVSFFMRWRLMLATLLGLVGSVALYSYTLHQGTSLEKGLESYSLLLFVGGGLLIVGLIIYLLFIKME